MKAIILAAGRGSRMGDLTDNKPKCLTVVNEKPLIKHQIETLSQVGIKDIALVTGYKFEKLKQYGTKQFYNAQWATTNMVVSLSYAQEWLDQDDCIISYSDIIYGDQIIKDLMSNSDDIAIGYDPNWLDIWKKRFENPLDDAETFKMNLNGYLTEIGSKPNAVSQIEGQYMGLLKFKKNYFIKCVKTIKNEFKKKTDMTTFLSLLLKNGYKIKGVSNHGNWFEFDSKFDLKCSGGLSGI